jgi:hypothetical protein
MKRHSKPFGENQRVPRSCQAKIPFYEGRPQLCQCLLDEPADEGELKALMQKREPLAHLRLWLGGMVSMFL